MPLEGLEPSLLAEPDFESGVSTIPPQGHEPHRHLSAAWGLKFREFLTGYRKLVLFKFSIVLLLLLYQTVLTFTNYLLLILFINFCYVSLILVD